MEKFDSGYSRKEKENKPGKEKGEEVSKK